MAKRALPSVVYHVAEAASWDSIRRHGLLSTSALLDAAALPRVDRERIESEWRRGYARLPSGIEISDQWPMPPRALERCLVGMTPTEWYRLINARVFFWLERERLNRQREVCVKRSQVVLVIDVGRLLGRHAGRVELTPINTGSAIRKPAPRGRATFVPYRQWLESQWFSEETGLGRPPRRQPPPAAELTVLGSVPDVMDLLVAAVPLAPSQLFTADVERRPRTAGRR